MRWPSRRGADKSGRAAEQPPVTGPVEPAPEAAASAEPAEGSAAGWAALPAMAPSWSSRAPLTSPAAPLIPPALPPAASRRIRSASGDGAPEPGRVVGLVAVVAPTVRTAVAPDLVADQLEGTGAARYADVPPLRHVSARPIVEHAPLTQATDDYVGQPVASAPPPPPPAAAARPSAQPPVEAMTDAGARFREALANLAKRGAPDSLPSSEYGSPPPREPVSTPRPVDSAGPVDAPRPDVIRPSGAMPHRRASLAESRRLGLGAPVRPSDQDPREPQPLTHPPADRAVDAVAAATAPPPPTAAPVETPPPAPPPVTEPPPAAVAPTFTPTAPAAQPDGSSSARSGRHSRRPADAGGADDDDSPDDRAGGDPAPRERIEPVPTVRPIIDGSARPTASSSVLVFRAAAQRGLAPAEAAAPRQVERAVVTRPPTELAQALRASHGIDVADVPVRRDSDASNEARTRGARAFTRAATVHLPDTAGAVTSAAARGLLAHELVHAAQQRRLGDALPGEDTMEGRRLEAEAVAAEHMYTRDAQLTPDTPLVHAPQPVSAEWVDERIVQHAPLSGEAPPTIPPTLEPMRQDIERVADHSARRVVEQWTNPALAGPAPTAGAPSSAPVHIPGLNQPAPAGIGPTPVMPTITGAPPVTPRPGAGAVLTEPQREQNYLDVLNAQHTRRGEPLQTELSPEDRDAMYNVWGLPGSGTGPGTTGAAGGTATQPEAPVAPTTMRWTPGQGFVASGPGADIATATARDAWGGGFMGSFGAQFLPPEPVTPTPSTTTPPATGPAAAGPATPAAGLAAGLALGTAAGAGLGAPTTAVPGAVRPGLPGQPPTPTTTPTTTPAATPTTTPTTPAAATPQFINASSLSMADALSNLFGIHHETPAASPAARGAVSTPAASPPATTAATTATHAAVAAAALDASAAHAAATGDVDLDRVDMEALSVRIYDHLRSKLRQEFLIDRERAGLLTDYR